MSRRSTILVCAAFFGFALPLASSASGSAPATLVSATVTKVGAGSRLILSFLGSPPGGWHLYGNGSAQFTLHFPSTVLAPGFRSPNNDDILTAVSIKTAPDVVDIVVRLRTSVVVVQNQEASSITIDVPPTLPEAQAAHPISPTANSRVGPRSLTDASSEVIPLKYADVSEVAGIVSQDVSHITPQDVFTPNGTIFSLPTQNNSFNQQYAAQPPPSEAQSFGERIDEHVAIDRRLNAIIISGKPDELASMRTLIQKLDVAIPSVMLKCEIVEISNSAARDLGIDYATSAHGPTATGSASLGPNPSSGSNTPVFTATFNSALYASIASGAGKVLASPQILAQSGMPAQILTGDALPIISTTVFPGPPVTTQTSVNYIPVGVSLQIQPRITDDGNVTAHVFAEVSSVTAEVPSPQGPVPQISLRQTNTTATVRDGESFVVGGLLRDEEISSMSRVPILSQLPIIGSLFRVEHSTTSQSNLYIVVTPHIVKQAVIDRAPVGQP